VDGKGDAGADLLLDEAGAQIARFAESYTGQLSSFDAGKLTQAMHEYAQIRDLIQRASVYSQLRFATDSADPVRSALVQHVKERATQLGTELQFFGVRGAVPAHAATQTLLHAERSGGATPG
jgi:oligoendopeptidase F